MALQTEGVVFDSLTSDPSSPVDGQAWYNSTDKKFRHQTNGLIEELSFVSSAHKASVRITTTNSIANLSNASATISGVTCVQGDRVLVANGASRNGSEAVSYSHNGIYEFGAISGGNGALTRTSDANTAKKLAGMSVFCQGCGTYHNLSMAASDITLETTLLTFNSVASKANADGTIVIDSNGTRIAAAAKSLLGNARSVRLATTANITLSGTQTIDGVSAVVDDRILVKNQTTGSQNGIYAVASGSWAYVSDWATDAVVSQMVVRVSEGTAGASTSWMLTNTGTITVGTTALTFSRNTPNSVSATGAVTTTSTTDVALTTMTYTPGAGDYKVLFSCRTQNGSGTATNTFSVYVNGSQIAVSERTVRMAAASVDHNMAFAAYVIGVAAGQAIEIRWKVSGNTGSTSNREMIVERAA